MPLLSAIDSAGADVVGDGAEAEVVVALGDWEWDWDWVGDRDEEAEEDCALVKVRRGMVRRRRERRASGDGVICRSIVKVGPSVRG